MADTAKPDRPTRQRRVLLRQTEKPPFNLWTAEFTGPALERAYRVETFPGTLRHNRIVAVIAGVAISTAHIAAGAAVRRPASEPAVMEAITHVVCNGFGFVTINPFDRVRPRRFATVRADRDANGQLLVQRKELKLFAGSLSTARDEAVCANRAKSEWLAHLSHEPRSPLNAIVGFSEVTVAQLSGRARR